MHLLSEGLVRFNQIWKGDYEVVIVNDGSNDETKAAIESIDSKTLPHANRIQKIHLDKNQGKGNALKVGVNAAVGDWILTLDADMATQPTEVINWQKMISTDSFDTNTIYIASRQHPESITTTNRLRKLMGRVFNKATQLFTPLKIQDTQCGFKLYPAKIGKELFAQLEEKGWAHDIEILLRAQNANTNIKEMPITWNHISNVKVNVLRDSWAMLLATIRIARRVRDEG